MAKRILIIDDDRPFRTFLSTILGEEGYLVEQAEGGKSGLTKVSESDYDLVITDLKMPDISGLDVIREGKKVRPDSRWIVITAYGSINNAVEAVKLGASDYLTKPLRDPDELRHVVARVIREAELEQRASLLSEELGKQFPPLEMIFIGEQMQEVLRLAKEVAQTPATVLIAGASGTGKELLARVIHQLSPRKGNPFVAVHCAALVETLLESELFGHEKGAFTGASTMRKGRFESAEGGTVFLDEIGDISATVQVKLLRVLQERVIERVGGLKTIPIDARVVAATNKDLKEEMAAGRFREDLFYRLNVFPIRMPLLTERQEAIIPLADYFVTKSATGLGKQVPLLTERAKTLLQQYDWPGNVRELQNVIERAVILSREQIDAEDLNLETDETKPFTQDGLLRQMEIETISRTLRETGGNRKKAAQILGISLRTLQYRIKEYRLS